MLFEVGVACRHQHKDEIHTEKRYVLVDAEDRERAKTIAMDFCDDRAAGDKNWVAFDWIAITPHDQTIPRFL